MRELSSDHHRAAATAMTVVACWLVLAAGYCYLHGVLLADGTGDLVVSLVWSLNQWGPWLLLAPFLIVSGRRAWPHAPRLLLLALAALCLSAVAKLVGDAVFSTTAVQGVQSAYLFVPRSAALLLIVLGAEAARLHLRQIKRPVTTARPTLEVTSADGRESPISQERIRFVRANGNYVEIEDGHESSRVRSTLRDVEQKLNPERFLRVHRSFVVNLDYVHGVERVNNSRRFHIRMKGGPPSVPVSRSGLKALKERCPAITGP